MPEIPASSPLEYIGVVSLIFGVFLILAGFNIINIQQISVPSGRKTYIFGIIFTLIGIVSIFRESFVFSGVSPTGTAITPVMPAETATLEPTQQTNTIFHDDFSDETSGWDVSADSNSERFYLDGEYVMRVGDNISKSGSTGFSTKYLTYYNSWSPAKLGQLTDVALDVDARHVSGSSGGSYGIIFYYQDPNNFYFYEVFSAGGAWDLVQRNPEGYYDQVTFQKTPAIRIGKSSNHLHLELSDTVTFYVNEQLVSTFQLPSQTGDVGLWITTSSEEMFEAAFDNFSVTQLSE